MLSLLFDIVVQPIIYVIELAFSLLYQLTQSPGASIVGVSVVVNLLCLPLYKMADDAQARERSKQASMARWVEHIKRHFTGDEQYMILSAYYDQQGYKPVQALVGSLPLLLQIPFFMAAYTYLSNLDLLDGASFLFLRDLGAPDALLSVGGITINLLPVLMTALNCASTAVYTRGLALRDKLQAYLLAVLFLVLLYDSPSGLVFYWTCNQLFSLGKNVVMKLLPQRSEEGTQRLEQPEPTVHEPSVVASFFLGAALLSALLGLLVPTAVIGDSPTEFVSVYAYVDPMSYVVHSLCVWSGLLVLWLGTYFLLSSPRGRRVMALVVWCLCGVALVDYFVYPLEFGNLSAGLAFDDSVAYGMASMLGNLAVLAAVCVGLVLVWRHARAAVNPALLIVLVGVLALSVPNIMGIRSEVDDLMASEKDKTADFVAEDGSIKPLFSLSRTGKNVVFLFLDRSLAGQVPYIMDEKPELKQQLDGFVYYPNTVSFGRTTNFGAPAVYGGYEYTPTAMNLRSDESLQSKHNEALLVLPTLFNDAGYTTTVVNSPYAGDYKWVSNMSLYDQLPGVSAYDVSYTVGNPYAALACEEYNMPVTDAGVAISNHKLFFYDLLRVVPDFLRAAVYDDGSYHDTSLSNPPRPSLISEWATLHYLPELTRVVENGDTFLQLGNCTPHQDGLLQLPNYDLAHNVTTEVDPHGERTLDGTTMLLDTKTRLAHYHVNAATLLQLGSWFDWMREQGVYDNTRIVLVSDHGRDLYQFPGLSYDEYLDVQMVNPLLMVKDFNAHGFTTSNEFMTNADAPVMAVEGVIADAKNPATGEPLTSDQKNARDQVVTASNLYRVGENNGNVFDTSDSPWYSVHDNIFDLDNWKRLD